jgi:predicted CoA-binding protein
MRVGVCVRGSAGYTITDIRPDYVVVGETKNYNIDRMEKAINLVRYYRRTTPPT